MTPVQAPCAADGRAMDTDLVRSLAVLASESDLSEIEVSGGGLRIRISRDVRAGRQRPDADKPAPMSMAEAIPDVGRGDVVASPMVGTVRRGSIRGGSPFVEVGSRVAAGDRLLVIEAMKTLNEIVAERPGTVVAAYVEDGRPVEYGEPLFLVA